MKLIIFTDGAFSPSRNKGGWAVFIPNINLRIAGCEFNTTVNRMEMIAAIEALTYISKVEQFKDCELEIYSDSMYLVGGMELGWKQDVNPDLWEKLNKFKNDLSVKFIHINGHSGIAGNEIVDKLAVKLSQSL